ncbi:MAG: YbbR-like domain-containing protein [Candidatus Omnitrophota bacterium]
MRNFLGKNFWLKISALILAVITWYYVDVEIGRSPSDERRSFWIEYTHENIIKEVKILPVIVGRPAEDYILRLDKVTVKPDTTFIIGPKRIISKIVSIKTAQIDITGQKKVCSLTVPLELIRGVRFYGPSGVVDITIPIEKAQ